MGHSAVAALVALWMRPVLPARSGTQSQKIGRQSPIPAAVSCWDNSKTTSMRGLDIPMPPALQRDNPSRQSRETDRTLRKAQLRRECQQAGAMRDGGLGR